MTAAEIVNKALVFASEKHKNQVRKVSGVPYIVHPMEVASIIATMTNDPEVIAAGLLHDTVEDCGVNPDEIREILGPRVSSLVLSETEDKFEGQRAEDTWMQRKEDSILPFKYAKDINVKIMWLADKLSNVRSFYRTYLKEGDGMWNNFHQKNPAMQKWYYYSILDNLSELSHTDAYAEYKEKIDYIFRGVNESSNK